MYMLIHSMKKLAETTESSGAVYAHLLSKKSPLRTLFSGDDSPPILLTLIYIIYRSISESKKESSDLIRPSTVFLLDSLCQLLSGADTTCFLTLWPFGNDDIQAILRQHLVKDPPDAQYAPWVNEFPASWRSNITCLTKGDWRRLKSIFQKRCSRVMRSSELPPYTRRPILTPEDVHAWIHAIMKICLYHLTLNQSNSSDWLWLRFCVDGSRSQNVFQYVLLPFNLRASMPTKASRSFRRTLARFEYKCYQQHTNLLEPYIAGLSWFYEPDEVPVNCLGSVWELCASHDAVSTQQTAHSTLLINLTKFDMNSPFDDATGWLKRNTGDISASVDMFIGFGSEDALECKSIVNDAFLYQVMKIAAASGDSYIDLWFVSVFLSIRLHM